MHQSKNEIEKKLRQAQYALKQLTRYEDRIFVHGGRDQQTGSYPLLSDLSSFLTQARSVLQYGYKEAKQRGMLPAYDEFVKNRSIIKRFKELRDSDIHQYMPGTHTTIIGSSPIRSIDPETGFGVGEPISLYVESLDDLDNPKGRNSDATVTTTITKRLDPDANLIQRWADEGRVDLVSLAQQGKPLYELFDCDGENNIFQLCRSYLVCVEEFYVYGMRIGFIT